MVKELSWGEFSILGLIEDFSILSILWRKLLFHLFCHLGQGCGKGKLSNVGVVLPQHPLKGCCIPLLSIDSGSIFRFVPFHNSEVLQKIALFHYSRIVMVRNCGSNHMDFSGSPVHPQVILC